MKKKVDGHIDWWKLLQNTAKSLKEYVAKNYPTGISFFGKEDHWNKIINGDGGSSAPPAEKPKPAPAHHGINPIRQSKRKKKRLPFRSLPRSS